MNQTVGFIGCGNMGGAMMGGIVRSGLFAPENIIASDANAAGLQALVEKYGVRAASDNKETAREADYLILAVKPYLYPPVIEEIRGVLRPSAVVITIAAGRTIASTQAAFGRPVKTVCAMPNTPALVGAGMSALCPSPEVSAEEFERALAIFRSFGEARQVPESLFDAVIAVSGSSPAYVYLFIEALADGAVREGMPRPMAYQFAAQAVLGSAKMVLETGLHPGALKDMVCSPGGTTIDAVAELEKTGLRASVLAAMDACSRKSKQMAQS